MRKNQRIFGLILARGGSKGVPRKNIKLLNGKPLIAYILEQAKFADLDEIWVSSDDVEIRNEAHRLGAKTLERPAEISQDQSTSLEALQHFIKNVECDIIVLLNACCPLTDSDDIDAVIKMALESNCDSVTSLVEDFSSHSTKLCRLNGPEGNRIYNLGHEFKTGERQTQDKVYKRNTAIYLMKRELIQQGKIFEDFSLGYIMPKERSWDINDMWDWKIAEFLTRK